MGKKNIQSYLMKNNFAFLTKK